MRARRAEQATRVEALLGEINHAVAALRRELGSERNSQATDSPESRSR